MKLHLPSQNLKIQTPLLVLSAFCTIACGDEGANRNLNLEAYRSIGQAEPAVLSEAQVSLLNQSISFYLVEDGPQTGSPEQSLTTGGEAIRAQMRAIETNPAPVNFSVNQTRDCSLSGSTEVRGTLTGEARQNAEAQVDYFFSQETTRKVMACNRPLTAGPISMTGEVATRIKVAASGTRVADPSEEMGFNAEQSELSYRFSADFNGSMHRDESGLKAEFRGFGIAGDISAAEVTALREAMADPLGNATVRERRNEWLREHLLCKGEVILDGQTFSCESIAAYFIEQ